MPDLTHERFNEAVVAHVPVAMEAQEALASVVDLNGAYQADIEQGVVTIAGRPLRVVLLGTVSKATGTWLWSWANQGFAPMLPAIAPVRRAAEMAGSWGLWELGEPQFSLAGVLDTGLGAGASVALVAAPLVGATAFYSADYGAGIAYFGIVDPAVPRPAAQAVTFPRRIMAAVDLQPGNPRAQVLTYAAVHNLRVTGDDRQLRVYLGPDVLTVTFDEQGRITNISGTVSPGASL
ncbi:DUF6882 domain-containing protein [Micropruina sp.]|uniref:DUF6882 domain-containing protein n=1 Tax=Micropruina sp. TaxID=2737536 RepID=UPI0026315649|nr:DUF6882 domain-containing protein [Micropruina sp.]